jgi:ABC-2 type transport system permease protein
MVDMSSVARYFRLLFALGRYGLTRELAFRANFLVQIVVEVLWLGILLVFYRTVFAQTKAIADWNEGEYLFFVGCYFVMESLMETLFLENCNQFADLVRNGDLDFILLKPLDEQFLVSCREVNWSTVPSMFLGGAVMLAALAQLGWPVSWDRLLLFPVVFACGIAIAYSFLLMLTSTAVWFVRNQSLYEMWWLFTSLMRYPREIFTRDWAFPIGWFFTFIIPVIVVANVPARIMVKQALDPASEHFDPWIIAFTLLATVILLIASRKFFRFSLRKYRSASS